MTTPSHDADATPNLGEFARYALTLGWDPLPLWGISGDGVCGCPNGSQCKTPGKHPVQSGWQAKGRLTKQDTYAYWDTETQPRNVGIRTGGHSSLWALDIDPKSGGDESLAALIAEHGPLPQTRVHRTGSGGTHYLFKLPGDFDVTNSRGRLPKGIDVRGNGGLIVGPGSVSGAGRYWTENPADVSPAPAWLLDMIRPTSHTDVVLTEADGVTYAHLSPADQERADRYVQAVRDGEIARLEAMKQAARPDMSSYDGEPWNQGVYEVACNLLEVAQSPWANYSLDDVKRDLADHAPTDRGFTVADVMGRLTSAVNKVKGKARPMPKADDTWALLSDGVRTATKSEPGTATTGWDQPDIGGQMRDRMSGDDEDDDLWIEHKNGTKSLDIPEAARRIMDAESAAMLADVSGGLWVYRDGAFVLDTRHVGRALSPILGRRWTPAHVTNVEKRIRTMGELLDLNDVAHPDLVNFRNGMVNWRTGTRVDHDPAYQSTFQIAADWDPEADCPLFAHYVDTMLEPEAATLLWEVIGYSMLPGNPMQVFVFFEGPGGNGKGVVQRVLVSLLGPGNVSSLSMAEIDGDNRFKLSRMVGRAANISGETPKTHVHDSSNLKAITGGDWVDVERKGVDGVQVRIHALPIFSVNEVPSLGDDSEGLFQRAIVIPFHRPSTEYRIEGFNEDAFKGELAGIARRGLEAVRAVRFNEPSLRATGFTLGLTGQRARRDFREQANTELDWVNNYLAPADDHWMTPTELYRAYGGRGERATRKFMKALRERFGEPVKAVPSAVTNWSAMGQDHPAKNARALCYGVRVSQDRIDMVRDLFGVMAEEAS